MSCGTTMVECLDSSLPKTRFDFLSGLSSSSDVDRVVSMDGSPPWSKTEGLSQRPVCDCLSTLHIFLFVRNSIQQIVNIVTGVHQHVCRGSVFDWLGVTSLYCARLPLCT